MYRLAAWTGVCFVLAGLTARGSDSTIDSSGVNLVGGHEEIDQGRPATVLAQAEPAKQPTRKAPAGKRAIPKAANEPPVSLKGLKGFGRGRSEGRHGRRGKAAPGDDKAPGAQIQPPGNTKAKVEEPAADPASQPESAKFVPPMQVGPISEPKEALAMFSMQLFSRIQARIAAEKAPPVESAPVGKQPVKPVETDGQKASPKLLGGSKDGKQLDRRRDAEKAERAEKVERRRKKRD